MPRPATWALAAVALLLVGSAGAGSDADEDELTVRGSAQQPSEGVAARMARDREAVAAASRDGEAREQQAGAEEAAAEPEPDPFDGILDVAMNSAALTTLRLNIQFEAGRMEVLALSVGEIPSEVAAVFGEKHGMEPAQITLAIRALGRSQLDYAWKIAAEKAESSRLAKPALVHVTLNVMQSEQVDAEPLLAKLHPGQSPNEAAADFAAVAGIGYDAQVKIAERLSEDQDELVYKVAAEHIKAVNQTSQATYLIDRMRGLPVGQLPHKGLREVIDAATALIAARKLMTIHVQTGSHAAATLTAYEGDDVKNLTAEFQATGGLSEEQGDLVRGAVLLTFHQHKIHAQRILAKVAENELPAGTAIPPTEAWYDLRTDSFKEPRPWEAVPPTGKPLFQLQYQPSSVGNWTGSDGEALAQPPVNITVYDGDLAVPLGEALSKYYGLPTAEGWGFAHYVASAYRKVSDQLNATEGGRPWKDGAVPKGMALFQIDLGQALPLPAPTTETAAVAETVEPADFAGVLVSVHEGDGPEELAAGVCRHYEVAAEGSAARAAAVGTVADYITAVFGSYFDPTGGRSTAAATARPDKEEAL